MRASEPEIGSSPLMTLWGGRFDEEPDDVLWRYTATHEDRRLLPWDVRGSMAHVAMLRRTGIVDESDAAALSEGLRTIAAEASEGTFEFAPTDEDVHSAVERRLIELTGPVGGKLHTGRSRNDQIALDLRLYLADAATARAAGLRHLAGTLADLASRHADDVIPSYTHLQQAQAISLGHHLAAHAWWALRNADRFDDARRRVAVSPLGASASGGSSLPLDPAVTAAELGWDSHFTNSLDAVGARDFASEYGFCCAQAMVDLSRLAEELVMWATTEFGWVTFTDSYTTGSSALPQKKNPDIAELARGRAAGAIGSLTSLLVLQKGLPLAYNRDLQEDKVHVFSLDDTLAGTVEALEGLVSTATFHPPAPSSFTTALDLAEALVGRGVPFREAHAAVGTLVAGLVSDGRHLESATVEDLTRADERFMADDLALVDPTSSASRRRSPGGGSPASVRDQVAAIRAEIDRSRATFPSPRT
ncbi:MAG TPA: argininosuccinate lyase [Acidimicrobiia bacterium]|nr:argininosuccinate lyase [Acidimicrobiia bacterium]